MSALDPERMAKLAGSMREALLLHVIGCGS